MAEVTLRLSQFRQNANQMHKCLMKTDEILDLLMRGLQSYEFLLTQSITKTAAFSHLYESVHMNPAGFCV